MDGVTYIDDIYIIYDDELMINLIILFFGFCRNVLARIYAQLMFQKKHLGQQTVEIW
jgi:hypothetical protein